MKSTARYRPVSFCLLGRVIWEQHSPSCWGCGLMKTLLQVKIEGGLQSTLGDGFLINPALIRSSLLDQTKGPSKASSGFLQWTSQSSLGSATSGHECSSIALLFANRQFVSIQWHTAFGGNWFFRSISIRVYARFSHRNCFHCMMVTSREVIRRDSPLAD